jgi:hypothetical protein
MCESARRDMWACIKAARPRDRRSVDWTCLPMVETCGAKKGRGNASLPVTTEDLTTSGLDIEIRDAPEGVVLARKTAARHRTLFAAALCIGVVMGLDDVAGSGITHFGYFINEFP